MADYRDKCTIIRLYMDDLLRVGNYDDIKPILSKSANYIKYDNDLITLFFICQIYQNEKENGQKTIFEKCGSLDEVLGRYTLIKFFLRRIEFEIDVISRNEIIEFLSENDISVEELTEMLKRTTYHPQKILKIIENEDPINE